MPLFAAGTDTRKYVSMGVAPSAREASSYSFGTASREVTATLIMDGRIIIASTIIAAKRLAPSGTEKILRIPGTRISIPTSPYTTEGMLASRLTADCMTDLSFGGAIFAI